MEHSSLPTDSSLESVNGKKGRPHAPGNHTLHEKIAVLCTPKRKHGRLNSTSLLTPHSVEFQLASPGTQRGLSYIMRSAQAALSLPNLHGTSMTQPCRLIWICRCSSLAASSTRTAAGPWFFLNRVLAAQPRLANVREHGMRVARFTWHL